MEIAVVNADESHKITFAAIAKNSYKTDGPAG